VIYKPSAGKFKDNCVLWHDGRYYLFSMYARGGEGYRNVWSAVSEDGVHFKDVGPVIANAPFFIWAMAVWKVKNRFYMNHGSFDVHGKQNILRFWESADLVHWTYMGESADVGPDPRWYDPNSRLDCMNVLPVVQGPRTRYYGYATGPGGFLESDDGIRWRGVAPPVIDWGEIGPPPTPKEEGGLEVGGCEAIDGRYYLLGGWFNYMGSFGYGVYTLVGDTPTGPFRPDVAAYRLCGNSSRWVALWARYCRTNDELLISSYMYDGHSYEKGQTWLPPLKKAVVDPGRHLRLGYWKGNDALKGKPIEIHLGRCLAVHPAEPARTPASAQSNRPHRLPAFACVKGNRMEIEASPERPSYGRVDVPTAIAALSNTFDLDKGIVLEGTIQATCRNRRLVAPGIGFYLEHGDREGTAIMLETYGLTRIGKLTRSDDVRFDFEDVTGPSCATVAGIAPHTPHPFRLLVRRNMYELYLDDRLVQTYNTTYAPGGIGATPRRLGFIVQNGLGIFQDVRAWQMDLA